VSATADQTCVVTLEPLTSDINEEIDLLFVPLAPGEKEPAGAETAGDFAEEPSAAWADNEPEPLIDGVVDIGGLATEFLILGLDPYPRKPGVVFEASQDVKADPGPFADLAKLMKG